jgi:hypothetical protein
MEGDKVARRSNPEGNDCDRRNNEGCAKRAQPERRKQNANPSPAPVRFIESPIATAPLPGVNPLSFARE